MSLSNCDLYRYETMCDEICSKLHAIFINGGRKRECETACLYSDEDFDFVTNTVNIYKGFCHIAN